MAENSPQTADAAMQNGPQTVQQMQEVRQKPEGLTSEVKKMLPRAMVQSRLGSLFKWTGLTAGGLLGSAMLTVGAAAGGLAAAWLGGTLTVGMGPLVVIPAVIGGGALGLVGGSFIAHGVNTLIGGKILQAFKSRPKTNTRLPANGSELYASLQKGNELQPLQKLASGMDLSWQEKAVAALEYQSLLNTAVKFMNGDWIDNKMPPSLETKRCALELGDLERKPIGQCTADDAARLLNCVNAMSCILNANKANKETRHLNLITNNALSELFRKPRIIWSYEIGRMDSPTSNTMKGILANMRREENMPNSRWQTLLGAQHPKVYDREWEEWMNEESHRYDGGRPQKQDMRQGASAQQTVPPQGMQQGVSQQTATVGGWPLPMSGEDMARMIAGGWSPAQMLLKPQNLSPAVGRTALHALSFKVDAVAQSARTIAGMRNGESMLNLMAYLTSKPIAQWSYDDVFNFNKMCGSIDTELRQNGWMSLDRLAMSAMQQTGPLSAEGVRARIDNLQPMASQYFHELANEAHVRMQSAAMAVQSAPAANPAVQPAPVQPVAAPMQPAPAMNAPVQPAPVQPAAAPMQPEPAMNAAVQPVQSVPVQSAPVQSAAMQTAAMQNVESGARLNEGAAVAVQEKNGGPLAVAGVQTTAPGAIQNVKFSSSFGRRSSKLDPLRKGYFQRQNAAQRGGRAHRPSAGYAAAGGDFLKQATAAGQSKEQAAAPQESYASPEAAAASTGMAGILVDAAVKTASAQEPELGQAARNAA